MKIAALFSDYDGTLSQLEARREDAVLSPMLRRMLTKVSKHVTFGIVTTKDLAFIRERVPFAHGISASCGLEMQVGERHFSMKGSDSGMNPLKTYQEVLKKILQAKDNLVIERKESDDENLVTGLHRLEDVA